MDGFDAFGDPYAKPVRRLIDRVLHGVGALDASLREQAAVGGGLPPPLNAYVEKVRLHAYRVLDEDIAALLQSGMSEEQIFELTQAAAHGAAAVRLDAALAAITGDH